MATSIPISGLSNDTTIVPTDFFPLVQSSSMTTFRTSINSFMTFSAQSGSASYASRALSASYAISASHADTASFAFNTLSSSYALAASQSLSSRSSSWASSSLTSSFSLKSSNSDSSSFSNWATSASITISSSYLIYNPAISNGTASFAISCSNAISASWSLSASFAQHAHLADSASYAGTASVVISGGGGGSSGIVFLTTPVIVVSSSFYGNGGKWYQDWVFGGSSTINGKAIATADSINLTSGFSTWRTSPTKFHVSPAGVPTTAKNIILDASAMTTWPDGSTQNPTFIFIRQFSITPDFVLLSTTTLDTGNAGQASSGQGIFPLNTSDHSFYWGKIGTGFNQGYIIRIIGYTT